MFEKIKIKNRGKFSIQNARNSDANRRVKRDRKEMLAWKNLERNEIILLNASF